MRRGPAGSDWQARTTAGMVQTIIDRPELRGCFPLACVVADAVTGGA